MPATLTRFCAGVTAVSRFARTVTTPTVTARLFHSTDRKHEHIHGLPHGAPRRLNQHEASPACSTASVQACSPSRRQITTATNNNVSVNLLNQQLSSLYGGSCCHYAEFHASHSSQQGAAAQTPPLHDQVIAIETNNIRYGRGALLEVGPAAAIEYGCKRAIVFTDKIIRSLPFFDAVIKSLAEEKVEVVIFDEVSIEPTNHSFQRAIDFAKDAKPDIYISVGGGSVMDTAKAANLYCSYPTSDFLTYVNRPIGLGVFPSSSPSSSSFGRSSFSLRPHLACPTTAGTGSESTGIAIFDHLELGVKTGISHRMLRPNMAFVDPWVTHSLPKMVCVSSAFDVMCHALESYTAMPHSKKPTAATPRERFTQRPLSQGSNRWADAGCIEALKLLGRYLIRACDERDHEARENLMFASLLAGIAFGNSGVHVPHAMSYAVAGNNRKYYAPNYSLADGPIIPHGMAVVLNAPAVFEATCSISPQRHFEAAVALCGGDNVEKGNAELVAILKPVTNTSDATQVGEALHELLCTMMKRTGIPNGLGAVGYGMGDIGTLVRGTSMQKRLLDNAPLACDTTLLHSLFANAMTYW